MDLTNAHRLLSAIPESAKVVDIGGGAAPFPRADYVIDAMPYQTRGYGSDGNIDRQLQVPPRYSADTWIQTDLCGHKPWPIEDKAFDFAICSHLLEDIRDPIWVCNEMLRVAKAGYIETPSRVVEQSKGVENPRHAGFYHHRWLVSCEGNRMEFRHKPHVLHSVNDAIVTRLSATQRIRPAHAIVTLDWTDSFEAVEVLVFDEQAVISELCEFARKARELPDLCENIPMSPGQALRRRVYFARLSMGAR